MGNKIGQDFPQPWHYGCTKKKKRPKADPQKSESPERVPSLFAQPATDVIYRHESCCLKAAKKILREI